MRTSTFVFGTLPRASIFADAADLSLRHFEFEGASDSTPSSSLMWNATSFSGNEPASMDCALKRTSPSMARTRSTCRRATGNSRALAWRCLLRALLRGFGGASAAALQRALGLRLAAERGGQISRRSCFEIERAGDRRSLARTST